MELARCITHEIRVIIELCSFSRVIKWNNTFENKALFLSLFELSRQFVILEYYTSILITYSHILVFILSFLCFGLYYCYIFISNLKVTI